MSDITKKNGLFYEDNLHTLVGVDAESTEFKGRVPFGPKHIADKAFAGVYFETISLPDSVKSVGFNLFENAGGVKTIKLPGALSELTPYMFYGCSSLEKINMPNLVVEFPDHLFYGCGALKEIPFRTDISYIGVSACEKCYSVKSIAFPDTVQTIDSRAFADCKSLESIVIGQNVTDISEDAFEGCTNVNKIRVDEANKFFYVADDGSLYRKFDDKLIIKNYPVSKQEISFFSASDLLSETDTSSNPLDNPVWIDEQDDEEIDDTFSAEIGADDDEEEAFGMEEKSGEKIPSANTTIESIMNQNTSTENIDSSVSVSVDEIAGVVSAMNDTNGIYTEDMARTKKEEKNVSILCNSAAFSRIREYEHSEKSVTNPTLYVYVEKLVDSASGEKTVSEKLMKCTEMLVNIHHFNRVIFFSGLPFENDEFVNFLTNMLSLQNVLVACEAESPVAMSFDARKFCEIGGVSLEKSEMENQQKQAGAKNATMLKLVLQDRY